jgi:solute carrier family 35 (UDP-galactose transporter), member B1
MKNSRSIGRDATFAIDAIKLAICIAVIYGAYITQGRVSEQLSKQKYGAQGHHFRHMEALIGFQCVACFLWAALLSLIFDKKSGAQLPQPWRYAFIGITNVIGPVCGTYALKNISYPAQVLAKSCKSVPIMLTGSLLYRKRYSFMEYASIIAIAGGVALFALSSGKRKGSLRDANPALGYSLVLANLLLDSLTNTGQDEIKRMFPKTSSLHMMCWSNFWGGLYYGLAFFGITHTGYDVIDFCLRHRDAGIHLMSFCLCGAIGQLGIFYTISSFGSLICSIVCTTRKFFSILLSVMLAGAALMGSQWLAVGLVFAGLLCKSIMRLTSNRKNAGKSKEA